MKCNRRVEVNVFEAGSERSAIMRTLLLLQFKKENGGLYTLSTGWNQLALFTVLKAENAAMQVFQQTLPNGYDLLDELLSYRPDLMLFYQDEENRKFLASFLGLLKRQVPAQQYIVWSLQDTQELEAAGLLQAMKGGEKTLSLSAYSKNLCPAELYSKLGIPLDVCMPALSLHIREEAECVCKELDYLQKNYPGMKEAIFSQETSLPQCDWECIRRFCEERGLQIRFLQDEALCAGGSYALWNGKKAFLTGIYPMEVDSGIATKHVRLDTPENSDLVYERLAEYVEANHTIFSTLPKDERVPSPKEVFQKTLDTGCLVSNEMCVEEPAPSQYRFTLCATGEKAYIRVQDYAAYTAGSPGEKQFVRIRMPEDFAAYKEDYRRFSETGILCERMWKPEMIDKCRFLNASFCHVDSLVRFRVEDQAIYPCHTSDYKAGDLDDSPYTVSIKVKGDKARSALNRDCATCIRSNSCSRCMALPTFLKEKEFCDFIRDPMHYHYLNTAVLSQVYLYQSGQLPELAVDPRMVQTVTPQNTVTVKPKKDAASCGLDFFCLLLKVDGKNPRGLLFSLKNRKILKLNEPFFGLCEMLVKGYTKSEILDAGKGIAQEHTKMDAMYAQGMSILSQYGMLQPETMRNRV